MKAIICAAVAAACFLGVSSQSMAQSNNAKGSAPGQDRACLVTTGTPGVFNDTDIVDSKWLPRKAAQAQAAKDPNTMMVDDYADDPLVGEGKDYATGEELCNEHFNN
ncbi:hypothetical protein ABIB57_004364 [Devosia sp. UYZn731]|uniref:hypothetical protein n=1 Tax=Devosia sp. UYZn731 TaxID=3156345 RepID=UPI0033996A5C